MKRPGAKASGASRRILGSLDRKAVHMPCKTAGKAARLALPPPQKNIMPFLSALFLSLLALCPGCEPPADGGTAKDIASAYVNSHGMEFALIPAGAFIMGADPLLEQASANESPRHSVSISRAFYLGRYEVTQAQWARVMGVNPSKFKGPDYPVDSVSWLEALEFILRLNKEEGHRRYRLPTEAEWEYAARAGASGAYAFGEEEEKLELYAVYEENSGADSLHGGPRPVGSLRPNAWGLYDMHGNVWEWVADRYGRNYYLSSPHQDPPGPGAGTQRLVRGGGWSSPAEQCRAAVRVPHAPDWRHPSLGLRLAMSLE